MSFSFPFVKIPFLFLPRIEKALEWMSEKVEPQDVFVLFLSGHGVAIDRKYHFLPYEFVWNNPEDLAQKSFTHEKLIQGLNKIRALKDVIILDTCDSGTVAQWASFIPKGRGLDMKIAIHEMGRKTGRTFLTASQPQQYALEGHQGHGAFSYFLLQGLKGEADKKRKNKTYGDANGLVNVEELAKYLADELPKFTYQKWGYRQIPTPSIQGDPFSLATTIP